MNKNLSDETLDRILGKLVKDSLLDEESIDEIAESPRLWRNVQRNIKTEKQSRKKSWFQLWDWQIPALSSLALIFCIGLLWFFDAGVNNPAVNQNLTENLSGEKSINVETAKNLETAKIAELPHVDSKITAASEDLPKIAPTKNISPKRELKTNVSIKSQKSNAALKQNPKNPPQIAEVKEEIKTEFIALAYSPIPESGQILKVKVPRSMMASLGIPNNVENGSELVNAEIILGDDGLTRAIRFVQ